MLGIKFACSGPCGNGLLPVPEGVLSCWKYVVCLWYHENGFATLDIGLLAP